MIHFLNYPQQWNFGAIVGLKIPNIIQIKMFQTRSETQIYLAQISFLTQFIDINIKFGEDFMNKSLSKMVQFLELRK